MATEAAEELAKLTDPLKLRKSGLQLYKAADPSKGKHLSSLSELPFGAWRTDGGLRVSRHTELDVVVETDSGPLVVASQIIPNLLRSQAQEPSKRALRKGTIEQMLSDLSPETAKDLDLARQSLAAWPSPGPPTRSPPTKPPSPTVPARNAKPASVDESKGEETSQSPQRVASSDFRQITTSNLQALLDDVAELNSEVDARTQSKKPRRSSKKKKKREKKEEGGGEGREGEGGGEEESEGTSEDKTT